MVHEDLSETTVRIFPVFRGNQDIEPGESINDTLYWKIPQPINTVVWVRLHFRVVSKSVEWNNSYMIRVENQGSTP
jgi:hypothetical protein